MRNIGFVGLGAMGTAMTKRLVEKQYRVTGFDLNADAIAALVANGGHGAASAQEAARGADALIVLVVNADQAEDVLFEQDALSGLANEAYVIVMSTCAPERVEAMAARVEAGGHRFIDAPISGGVAGIEAGTLTIMAGTPAATFEGARPLLSDIGENLYHVGEQPGQGSAMKTVNQLLAGVHIAVSAEGLAFAERAGIDPALALEILSGSAASSWMLNDRGPRMVDDPGDGDVRSAVDIFVKDLGIVLGAGQGMRMGLPLAAAAHQLFLSASGAGEGRRDDSQVITAYRKFTGHN